MVVSGRHASHTASTRLYTHTHVPTAWNGACLQWLQEDKRRYERRRAIRAAVAAAQTFQRQHPGQVVHAFAGVCLSHAEGLDIVAPAGGIEAKEQQMMLAHVLMPALRTGNVKLGAAYILLPFFRHRQWWMLIASVLYTPCHAAAKQKRPPSSTEFCLLCSLHPYRKERKGKSFSSYLYARNTGPMLSDRSTLHAGPFSPPQGQASLLSTLLQEKGQGMSLHSRYGRLSSSNSRSQPPKLSKSKKRGMLLDGTSDEQDWTSTAWLAAGMVSAGLVVCSLGVVIYSQRASQTFNSNFGNRFTLTKSLLGLLRLA
eukprot:1139494-Pelagomonas_calceolata.AAC.2